MGLDVYLYKYDDYVTTTALEGAATAFSDATWNRLTGSRKYEELSQSEKDAARGAVKTYYAERGLSEYGEDEARKRKIRMDSATYPDHLFKVGYLRSSYNEGGFDRVVGNAIGVRLSDIFQTDGRYEFQPDWPLAREIAVDVCRRLRAAPHRRVTTVDAANLFGKPLRADAAEALRIYAEEMSKPHLFDGSFSCHAGAFFGKEGVTVLAAIAGVGVLGNPVVHLIYEDHDFDWYIHAAEIVLETIDCVLAQPDRDKFWLHWSS